MAKSAAARAAGEVFASRPVAVSPIDVVIEAAAAAMRVKHPGGRPSMTQVVERSMAAASRDRDVLDARDRRAGAPMRFVAEGEVSTVVLPRGAARAKGGG